MNRTLTITLLILAIHLVAPSSVRGNFDAADWQFYREIQVPRELKSGYVFFQVDADIYDGCHTGLDSLRIVDSSSNEIPYEIVEDEGSVQRKELSSEILSNSYTPGQNNVLVLDTGKEPPEVSEMELQTSSRNFMRGVSVEGSKDQHTWNTIVKEAYIFNFHHDVEDQDLHIELPPSQYRYLRLKVFDDGSGELKLTGAKIFMVTKTAAATEPWELTIIDRINSDDNATSDFTADAIYFGLPIQQIKLDIPGQNYQRMVHIQSSDDRNKWVDLGTSVIFSYDLPQFKRTDDLLSFGENASGHFFKLTMDNYDERLLDVTGVSGIGLIRRVVLSLKGKDSLKVYYGNPSAKKPDYKSAPQVPYVQTQSLPRLELGPRQTTVSQPQPEGMDESTNTYFFWFIAAVVIFFLIIFTFGASRPTQRPGPPGGPDDM